MLNTMQQTQIALVAPLVVVSRHFHSQTDTKVIKIAGKHVIAKVCSCGGLTVNGGTWFGSEDSLIIELTGGPRMPVD